MSNQIESFMKKTLLSLAAVTLTALGSLAGPYTTAPAEGEVDTSLEPNAGGLSSIDITLAGATVNRSALGYATLTYNGKTVMNIPASNARLIYTINGFDKNVPGDPHITFWDGKLADSPYLAAGDYTIVIPRGFFYTSAGQETPQQVYHYTIPETTSVACTIDPAYGTSVSTLKTVTLTYPAGAVVTANSASPVNVTVTGAGGDSGNVDENDSTKETFTDVPVTFSINGNVVTVTLTNPITTPGMAYVNTVAGGFSITMPNGSVKKSEGREHMINISGAGEAIEGEYSVTPAIGTYTEFKAIDYSEERGLTTPWYGYFHVKMPKGLTLTMNKGFSSKLVSVDGSYSKVFAAMPDVDKTGFYLYDAGEYSTPADIKLANGAYQLTISGKIYCAQGTQTVDLTFGPYQIVNENEVKYTLSPANGSTLQEITEIVVTFPEAKEVKWNNLEWASISSKIIEYDYKGVVDGNKVTISFNQPLDIPSLYTLQIPGNALIVDGMHLGVTAEYNVERFFVTDLNVTSDNGEVKAPVFTAEGDMMDNYWTVDATFDEATQVPEVTFEIPSGYTSFAYQIQDVEVGPEVDTYGYRIPGGELEGAGFKVNETGVVTGLRDGVNTLAITFGSADAYVYPTPVFVNVNRGVTSVEVIEAADAEVSYYTLQGVKVANPEKGIYIKVVGNKAAKVAL